MRFKHYLLNENKSFLYEKIGDILNAIDNLEQDADNIGNRQLIRSTINIVNQIRQILHDSWPDEEITTLRELQKCGVALMKAIDSNKNLREVIRSASELLHKMLSKSKQPKNDIGSGEE